MKITFDAGALKSAVKLLDKTNKSKTNPYVRIRSTKEGVILGTSDMVCTTEVFLGGDVEGGSADFQVDRDIFTGLVKMAKGSEISLEKKEKNLVFKSGKYTAKITFTLETVKYFEIKPEGVKITLPLEDVLKGLNKVAYSASFDATNAQLGGIVWSFDEKGIKFVGADGFRMAYASIDNPAKEEKFMFMAPIFSVETFKALAKDIDDEELILYYNGKSVILETDSFTMAMRLSNTEIYDFRSILGMFGDECKSLTSRKELIDVFNFVNVISKNSLEGERPARLSIDSNGFAVNVSGETGVSDNKVDSEVKGSFKPDNVGFYPSNILDVLKRAEGEEVVIEFLDSSTPMIIYEPTEGVIEWKAYIMPVQMRGGK